MNFSSVDKWIEEKTGALDSAGLAEYQLRKARLTFEYVKARSSFYKERLKGCDGFAAVSELPFTFPRDIERFSSEMLCVGQGMVNRIVTHQTSGTSANPKRVFFTANDQEATIDFFHHGMNEFTSENDTVLILFPGEKEGSIGRLLAEGLARLGARAVIYGIVLDFDALLSFIRDKEINVIAGLPQQALEFSRLCRRRGISLRGLHSVLLSADHVAGSLVRAVEANLGCAAYEHYGMTETCFGGGVYSKDRDGYHLRHNDFLFEIVDPRTGTPLPDGERGEIVFTSLNTEAMPLIRYRTGDLASFSPRAEKYPVMEKMQGRLKDGARLPDGQILKMNELEEVIFGREDVLDFRASYKDNALELYVRSLRFDADGIIAALRGSPLEAMLRRCEIKVTQAENFLVYGNTMNKRTLGQV